MFRVLAAFFITELKRPDFRLINGEIVVPDEYDTYPDRVKYFGKLINSNFVGYLPDFPRATRSPVF
jgi:hypothetical protein